jgi:hypothetical protein
MNRALLLQHSESDSPSALANAAIAKRLDWRYKNGMKANDVTFSK